MARNGPSKGSSNGQNSSAGSTGSATARPKTNRLNPDDARPLPADSLLGKAAESLPLWARRINWCLPCCSIGIIVAFITDLSRLSLEPIYNSIPLRLHQIPQSSIPTLLSAAVLLILGAPADDTSASRRATIALGFAGVWAALAGVYGRYVGNMAAESLGAEWGALSSRLVLKIGVVVGTLVWASSSGDGLWYARVRRMRIKDDVRSGHHWRVVAHSAAFTGVLWYFTRMVTPWTSGSLSFLTMRPERSIILLSTLFPLIALADAFPPRSSTTQSTQRQHTRSIFLISVLIHALVIYLGHANNAFVQQIPPYPAANGTLSIISSERSITGQIVVADDLERGLRYLRCDASLLGGRWYRVVPDGPGKRRTELTESIFATFSLQEIGLLAHRQDEMDSVTRTVELTTSLALGNAQTTKERQADRALIIGLGVGIAASAFARSGYNVDIVEIDPLVYRAAADHFGLRHSPNGTVNLQDGAAYVQELAEQRRSGDHVGQKWDLVVQDCFTGGSVPGEMFTAEFWSDLKENVAENGIVAMNFVGLKHTKASRAVLVTLLSSFEQCRAFEESINMVVLCTSSPSPLLTFRRPTPTDIKGSPLRDHVYNTFHNSEVRLDDIVVDADFSDPELRLERGKQRLNEWQVETGLSTWTMIRKILAPAMWLAY